MLDLESSEMMEREEVSSDLDKKITAKLWDQDYSWNDSVDGSLVGLLVRYGTISHYKMPIGS